MLDVCVYVTMATMMATMMVMTMMTSLVGCVRLTVTPSVGRCTGIWEAKHEVSRYQKV